MCFFLTTFHLDSENKGYLAFFYKIYPHRVFVKRYFLIPASSPLTKTDPYDLHLHDSVAGSGEEAE